MIFICTKKEINPIGKFSDPNRNNLKLPKGCSFIDQNVINSSRCGNFNPFI
ncbi:hypothetical protein Hanom_Chr07g00643391 [Helianthus anomalus]